MSIYERIDTGTKEGHIPPQVAEYLRIFFKSCDRALSDAGKETSSMETLYHQYLDGIAAQITHPADFDNYHTRITEPIDYTHFGTEFIRPFIDREGSTVLGRENLTKIREQLARGDNVFFLANHQSEVDPQVIKLLLEPTHDEIGQEMIFVAGHRVTSDPTAVPFSLGCNLLCIYSKKHIDHPPEKRHDKQHHNAKTMKRMRELLEDGGHCVYIAPSGGRDRPDDQGILTPDPFDPPSLEMTILQVRQVHRPTHFYPLALLTYPILPPPNEVRKELGEKREVAFAPVHLAIGDEIDIDFFDGHEHPNKKERRAARAAYIFSKVSDDYRRLQTIDQAYKQRT